MRNQPIETDAWEMEARRRREVIEADFGVMHEVPADGAATNTAADSVRRFATWIAGFGQSDPGVSSERVEHAAPCRSGLSTSKSGT